MWDITIHPLPSGPRSLLALIPFFHRCGTTTKSTSFRVSVLTGTLPCVYPLWGIARRLTHRPVTGSDIICNDPNPPLAHIVLFVIFFWASPQGFKTYLVGEGFHTLVKTGDLFSSPTNVGYHNPPPSEASVFAGSHSFHQSMWDYHQIYPLWGQRPYWHTDSCLPPLGNSEKADTSSGDWLGYHL